MNTHRNPKRWPPATCLAVALVLVVICGLEAGAEFAFTDIHLTNDMVRVEFESSTSEYYLVVSSPSVTTNGNLIDVVLGVTTNQSIDDDSTNGPAGSGEYYAVVAIQQNNPLDLDADGMDDVFELNRPFLSPLNPVDAGLDQDGDSLSNLQEYQLNLSLTNVDTDGDAIWDAEEVNLFGSDPLVVDSDGDGMGDGSDPQPLSSNTSPTQFHAVFSDNATGTARQQLTDTRFQINHLVFTPDGKSILYQTYLQDTSGDGDYDESDTIGTAVGIMNADGTRPRILTDLGTNGYVGHNGSVDAVPEPSPDGKYIIFTSDRHRDPPDLQLRSFVMDMNGSNITQLAYESNAPAADELDADPDWGPENKIIFKRFKISGPTFARIYSANLDTNTWTLTNIVLRTDGSDTNMANNLPGDADPKISFDGSMICSYRNISTNISLGSFNIGDWDMWVGPYSSTNQPGTNSICYLQPSTNVVDAFPRWNQNDDKLAFIFMNPDPIAIDINVVHLNIVTSPTFSASVILRTNITAGAVATNGAQWLQTMPCWSTDTNTPDRILYSGWHQ